MAFFKNVDVVTENTSVDPIYESSVGLGVIKLDCIKFDNDCFKAAIKTDIREQMMVNEGATTAELVSFQEVSMSGMWEKIKDFFKKLWNKIKAYFRGWYARFYAWFTSNNKKFYDTFKKEVDKKRSNGELQELEVTWRKAKNKNFIDTCTAKSDQIDIKDLATKTEKDDNTYAAVVKSITSATESIENRSELKDYIVDKTYDDEEQVEFTSIYDEVIEELKSADKAVKEAKKTESSISKVINSKLKEVEREAKGADKDNKTEFKTQPAAIAAALGRYVSDICAISTEMTKSHAAMARKAFARAVSYKYKY